MDKVLARHEKVVIPTYGIAEYDKNPMFLEKRVYQGSSGRVYPHPVCYGVADTPEDREYDAIFLENDYISVMILPELGGRIQRLLDKTNGQDAVYYNEVIKPALVGLAGPWISGGIEFNWPQHHRPSTFDPVDHTVTENGDGSVTVWVGETEHMFHTKCSTGFTLYPDRAYLEITGRLYNPTDTPQTFLWWANPAIAVNENTQSIFPPDVFAVMDHGKRDVSKFPIADGVYYKVDYAPGTDISRYKNIPVPTSYMAYHSDFDFIGNYDHEKRAGLLHIADHHISPGKKQWTWGNGDFGRAWDRNLTDKNGPYIELMTGVYTDNQPDFTFLRPHEEKTFRQYFMPYKDVGEVKNASLDAAINVSVSGGRIALTVYTPSGLDGEAAEIYARGELVHKEALHMETASSRVIAADAPGCGIGDVTVRICRGDRVILSCAPVSDAGNIPAPASPLPPPEEIPTNEKLFLAAVHLEQYRHATFSPEPYYLEGLRRDPDDIRINTGYGKYLYARGLYRESIKYFRAAAASATWKNPNPYDCEPFYCLGLALLADGKTDEAFDAFYKACWDGAQKSASFYRLACISASRGNYADALGFVRESLVYGAHDLAARGLCVSLLRLLNDTDGAIKTAFETKALDPLDHACRYELYLLTGEGLPELLSLMRGDPHSFIELAIPYMRAGMTDEADRILALSPESPLVHYYRRSCTHDAEQLALAEAADPAYCFPNRLTDMDVLGDAAAEGGVMAKYYLGLLLYDKGRWKEAVGLWEACAADIEAVKCAPTVFRNLALAYYNKLHDGARALDAMTRAFALDTSDARVFFELDCLRRELSFPPEERLRLMEEHTELLPARDDLYTEYITLLNLCGRHDHAYELMMSHRFHPWEGGEGKITAQYRRALMKKAESAGGGAEAYLRAALSYPENLGEGKLVGCLDNDIYYFLGKHLSGEEARDAFRLAARGGSEIANAAYYNDQPPEMMYYSALALRELGETEEARRRFDLFVSYANEHMDDVVKPDYFAVSLPDLLVFESDLSKKNRLHCFYMASLGYLGRGEYDNARECAEAGLRLDPAYAGLIDALAEARRAKGGCE